MLALEGLLRDATGSQIKAALDIEGVLADITTPVIKLYNEIHGTRWAVQDITDWGFKAINADVHEMMTLFNRVWAERFHEIRYEGDTQLIHELGSKCGLDIVTSRTGVDAQLGIFLGWNGLGRLPLVINPPTREKTELQYKIYIDDSPVLAGEVAKTEGRIILLVDRPWNQDVQKHDRIFRVPDVNAAAFELIRGLRRNNPNRIRA